ncbi:MAG TPA: hypothetical protein VLH08_16795, partial [Acidobacteriota bacterium]|nr:hypothetical protein [Acidobacteriota bacterium]
LHSDTYLQYWIYTAKSNFSKNTVILFGRAPTLTSVTTVPPYFHPQSENQTITLNFSTFNGAAPTATVTLTLQETNTVLRTFQCPSSECTLAGQSYTIIWNGKAMPANSWVAKGAYTVTATITDSIGNTATGRILTQVQYH